MLFINNVKGDNYLSLGVGISKVEPVKIHDNKLTGYIKPSQIFPNLNLAFGRNFTEDLRGEIALNYNFLFTSKENLKGDGMILDAELKTKINTFMLNVYKDVSSFNNVKVYVGGGIGVSSKKETAKGILKYKNKIYDLKSTPSKESYRFAYKVTLGSSMPISENLHLDVSYNYFNLGFNRRNVSKLNTIVIHKRKYDIHNITLNFRYKI